MAIVEVAVPAFAVTVIERELGSFGVVSTAVAAPVVSVTPCVTAKPPESAVNATVTPETKLLLASRTNAVMVAGAELSDGSCGALVCRATVCLESVTVTVVWPVTLPLVAVTVMVAPAAALPARRVAVTVPVASVVDDPAGMLPELALKPMVAPVTAALFASFATTVMVALADPSDGIVAVLVVTVREVTVVVVVLPPPPPVLSPVEAPWKASPPQAASSIVTAARAAIEKSFFMSHPYSVI
jgi:hypothetical protein